MRKFQSLNPSNSRVFINFNNKENPVSFEYPDKSSAFSVIYFPIAMAWSVIQVIFLFVNIPTIIFILSGIAMDGTEIMIFGLATILGFLFFMFSIPALITWIILSNKELLKKMPLINTGISKIGSWSYNRVFVNKLDSKIYEIPVFDNVFIEYHAKGDFGKYLDRIEVTEHDFYCISVGMFSKKEKKVRNTDYWKVKFYFKRIPKEGYLKVDYL